MGAETRVGLRQRCHVKFKKNSYRLHQVLPSFLLSLFVFTLGMQVARSQLHTEDDSNEVFNDVSLSICPVLPLSKSYFPFVPSSLLPVGGNDELDEANGRRRQDGTLGFLLPFLYLASCFLSCT